MNKNARRKAKYDAINEEERKEAEGLKRRRRKVRDLSLLFRVKRAERRKREKSGERRGGEDGDDGGREKKRWRKREKEKDGRKERRDVFKDVAAASRQA